MDSNPPNPPCDEYILGRSSQEYQRLRHQAEIWEFATSRILQRLDLHGGMSCLDIGCGPGDVMRLMGDIVGATGRVTGVDMDGKVGNEAIEYLRSTSASQFIFLEKDVEAIEELPGQPFDLTYARNLLIHVRDPIAMLRKVYGWTKPGGYIVIQDYDVNTLGIYPKLKTWEIFEKVFIGTMNKIGRDTEFGRKLPAYFIEAGIGKPDGTDVAGLVGSLEQYGRMYQASYKSVLPRALQMGLITEGESEEFTKEISEAIEHGLNYSALMPIMIGVWKRKPE